MSRLSRADMRYFQKARQAAEISDYKRTHVGCVAVYQGNIIGIACNTNKTHPMQKYYNRYRYHPQTSYFYPKLQLLSLPILVIYFVDYYNINIL